MKNLMHTFSILALTLISSSTFLAQQPKEKLKESFRTVAGELKVVELSTGKYLITLRDKIVLETNANDKASEFLTCPEPRVYTYYKKHLYMYKGPLRYGKLVMTGDFASYADRLDEVVLFQQHAADPCLGGRSGFWD